MGRYFFNLRYGNRPDAVAVDQEGSDLTTTGYDRGVDDGRPDGRDHED